MLKMKNYIRLVKHNPEIFEDDNNYASDEVSEMFEAAEYHKNDLSSNGQNL